MAYQTLYRKYRPSSFSNVYGQDVIVKTLKNIIKNNKLSHAYLFTGPRGTGKTSTAKIFAKVINCLNNNDGDACNCCESCKSYNDNSNPDIIEIDAASNNGVDEIRELKSKISLVPSESKYKVYIIDEVHMLSIGAFNALLKTLEEPPKHVIFILATTEPQKIPLTVISRCQRFDFKSINQDAMRKCLERIISEEKIKIEDDAVQAIIESSDGGLRNAIGLLDQAWAFCDKSITKNDIDELTGSVSNEEIDFISSDIIFGNLNDQLKKIENYYNSGKDLILIFQKIINYLEKKLINSKINKEKISDENKLYLIIEELSSTIYKMKQSYDSKSIIEIELIKLNNMLFNVPRETSEVKSKTNVPRETSEVKSKTNVPRETSEVKSKTNVPRETLTNEETLINLKKARINNILMNANKDILKQVMQLWQTINDYLIIEDYKTAAKMLCVTIPVASSEKGLVITVPTDDLLNEIEENYDKIKLLISKITQKNPKIVFVTNKYWTKARPEYAEKAKKHLFEQIDEELCLKEYLNALKDKKFTNEFNEFVEMEDK